MTTLEAGRLPTPCGEQPHGEALFRCPACRVALPLRRDGRPVGCHGCRAAFPVVEEIPLLVKDRAAIERQIEEARHQGRAEWYDASQAQAWTGPYRHHLKKRVAYLERVLSAYRALRGDGLSLLDLGCGDGENLRWLSRFATTCYGSDYHVVRLRRARQVPGVTQLFLADATDYPTRDGAFDVIVFNHVLEHIPDDDQALREAHRILRPGGLLILGVPNEGAWFWQLAYRLQPQLLKSSDHVHFYTAETVRRKCRAAGFNVQAVDPIGWGVPHWTLDALIRRFRWVDDALEQVGRRCLRSQATSLYLLLTK